MATFSTIPAAKSALKVLLDARPGLAGVTIGWDKKAELMQVIERVYLYDTIEHDFTWVVLTPRHKVDEKYTLQVVVDVFGSGDDPTPTETRMWELVGEILQAVIGDLSITGTVRQSKPDGVPHDLNPTDDGWIAHATVRIACEARI
jgi:hypothetical protein